MITYEVPKSYVLYSREVVEFLLFLLLLLLMRSSVCAVLLECIGELSFSLSDVKLGTGLRGSGGSQASRWW